MKIAAPKQLAEKFNKYVGLISRYRVVLIILAIASTIGYTTIRSQSYLSPSRDETAYDTKRKELSNFQTIDYQFAEKLKESVNDVEVKVNQNLPGNRVSPFTE